jgi:hypothetical protein
LTFDIFESHKAIPMEFVQAREALGHKVNGFLSAVPTALSDVSARLKQVDKAMEQWTNALGF